jgi:hypothetical protein
MSIILIVLVVGAPLGVGVKVVRVPRGGPSLRWGGKDRPRSLGHRLVDLSEDRVAMTVAGADLGSGVRSEQTLAFLRPNTALV